MTEQTMTHEEQMVALRRIEGQVRGIHKMIEEKRYCIDILTQLSSVTGALLRVQDMILQKHLKGCVTHALQEGSEPEKQKKVDEVVDLLKKFRRGF